MPENGKKKFKKPPKKYQPKGLNFLYEDRDILVVEKESGLLTVGTEKVRERSALYLLNNYIRKGDSKSRKEVYIVHRLDRDTSGILIFAKTEQAQRHLQDEWANFQKLYYAVVLGVPEKKEDMITSYLTENSAHRVYSTEDSKKGKLAKTVYKVIKESPSASLLEINLLTGRKNQIRVHLTERGHPVLGDKKYSLKRNSPKQDQGKGEKKTNQTPPESKGSQSFGGSARRLALHAASLTFTHPFSKEEMTFQTEIPPYFHSLLKGKPSS